MKKKLVSSVLFGVWLLGGITIVSAADSQGVDEFAWVDAAIQKNAAEDSAAGTPMATPAQLDAAISEQQKSAAELDAWVDARREESLKEMSNDSSTPSVSPSGGSSDMTSAGFKFDVSDLSPSEKQYKDGTKLNLKNILANIGKYLLIATTTIAVLSLVVGGLMISTTGPSDRAAKGKTIIVLNITAIIIALFSYSIIRLVSWLIA